MNIVKKITAHCFRKLDWWIMLSIILIFASGLVTMYSFVGENTFFAKQVIWISISVISLLTISFLDVRFLRDSRVVIGLYIITTLVLSLLLIVGQVFQGAQSWFSFGGFALQPSEFAKIAIIILLAKYFTRRHVEIAHIKHILLSGLYSFIFALLVFLQGDFGSAIIILAIWFGMILVSGVSRKHIIAVMLLALCAFLALWFFGFNQYQKQRIISFIDPLTDLQGSGYHAYQSTIAVGSGQMWGKGIGFGTQSRLQFLPEYQTDFIFSAFAEEWGFVGASILILVFFVLFWRILSNAREGASNFETFFAFGILIWFVTHFIIHIGMNVGLLPVTGLPLPFASYGGSHILAESVAVGILMAMRGYRKTIRNDTRAIEVEDLN